MEFMEFNIEALSVKKSVCTILVGSVCTIPCHRSLWPSLGGIVAAVNFDGLKGQPSMSKLSFQWDGRMQPRFPNLN